MKLIKKLFGQKEKPANWNLTVNDLMQEYNSGKRNQIRKEEMQWAHEYEQSLIPNNQRIPRKSDLFEAKESVFVNYIIHYSDQSMDGGSIQLEKGEQVWIDTDPVEDKPIAFSAKPMNQEETEKRILLQEATQSKSLDEFYLSINTISLLQDFILIEENFDPPT